MVKPKVERKICPLTVSQESRLWCYKEGCAWWTGECVVITIANKLHIISEKLTDLSEVAKKLE